MKIFASFKNEMQKLLNKKKYIVFLILSVLICVGNVVLSIIAANVSKGAVNLKISNLSMNMLGFFIEIFIPFVVFMAATDLFCSEDHDQTLRAILVRPVSRFKIFVSKLFAVLTIAVINLMLVFLTTVLLEIIFGSAGMNFLINLAAYILNIIPLFVIVLMAAFINQMLKGPTLVMFLCIALYFGLKLSYLFSTILNSMVFTSYLQWHKLWLGNTLPFGSILSKVILIVAYAVIFFAGGYYLFEKKEV